MNAPELGGQRVVLRGGFASAGFADLLARIGDHRAQWRGTLFERGELVLQRLAFCLDLTNRFELLGREIHVVLARTLRNTNRDLVATHGRVLANLSRERFLLLVVNREQPLCGFDLLFELVGVRLGCVGEAAL